MLTIRQNQIEVFKADQLEQFVREMIERLRQRFPEQMQGRPDEQLRALVEAGREKAQGHGLESRAQIRFFIDLMVIHGTQFDTSPVTSWAGEILGDDQLSAEEKLRRLDEVQAMFDKERP